MLSFLLRALIRCRQSITRLAMKVNSWLRVRVDRLFAKEGAKDRPMRRRAAYLDGDAGCVERLKPVQDCFRQG